MRGKCIFILAVLWSFLPAANVDSLETRLNEVQNQDRLPILLVLAEELSYDEPEQAIAYGQEALELAQSFNDRASEAASSRYIADACYYQSDFENSLSWYEKAAELVKEISGAHSAEYGQRLGDVAYCEELLLRHLAAIVTYQKALSIAREHKDWQEIITLLNNIGNCYYKAAEYDKAMDYLQQTLRAEEEYGNEADKSMILNSIGMVYQAWKENAKAISYYEQALEIDRKYGNEGRMAIRLNNLGYIYQDLKNYDQALSCFLEALELEKKSGDERRLVFRLSNISSLYIARNDYDHALEYLQEVDKYLKKYNDIEVMATYYENYGNYYYHRGMYEKALQYHLESLKLAEGNNLESLRRSSYSDLSAIYKELGNFEAAYLYLNKYMEVQDSLFTEEKHRQIAELEMKYETEKKEKEIELLRKSTELQKLQLSSNKRMRNLLILILILVLLLALALFISYRRKMEVKRIRQEKKAMEQSRLAILGEVAAGIVHEINQPLQSMSFTLENVSSALKDGYADAAYLEKKTGYLSDDVGRMQHIINHIRTFSHNRSEEKREPFDVNECLRNALNMTRERYIKQGVHLEVELAEKLPSLTGNIFSFEQVILILLSNARDAVEARNEAAGADFQKKIYLHTELREKQIVVQVGDNGLGIPEEVVEKIFKPFFTTKETGKGTGLGLSIAKGIISEMGGDIAVNTVEGKGTIIKLSFDIAGDK